MLDSSRHLLLKMTVVVCWNIALASCSQAAQKLDEVVFYEGPRFKLKLVRYYENLPLHYTGEVFRVQCASERTGNSPGHKTQDPGWRTLGNGGAIGSKNAAELVERERGNYLVIDDQTLVWIGNGVSVSFDACGQFRAWYPTSLPEELIDPVEKPDLCAPKGKVDCRQYNFQGDRAPHFGDIQVNATGNISFTVRSKAFRDKQALHVHSTDFGRTWTVTSIASQQSRSSLSFEAWHTITRSAEPNKSTILIQLNQGH